MKSNYFIHLVECQCILPFFKNKTKPLYHKFKVFSTIDENDNFVEKFAICDNCNAIHKITEIQKSEIIRDKQGLRSLVRSIEDITFNFENENLNNVVSILLKYKCDISTWEKLEYIYDNNLEGHNCVVFKEDIGDYVIVKYLELNNKKFKLKDERYKKEIKI